jgi:hypothetical protein
MAVHVTTPHGHPISPVAFACAGRPQQTFALYSMAGRLSTQRPRLRQLGVTFVLLSSTVLLVVGGTIDSFTMEFKGAAAYAMSLIDPALVQTKYLLRHITIMTRTLDLTEIYLYVLRCWYGYGTYETRRRFSMASLGMALPRASDPINGPIGIRASTASA